MACSLARNALGAAKGLPEGSEGKSTDLENGVEGGRALCLLGIIYVMFPCFSRFFFSENIP